MPVANARMYCATPTVKKAWHEVLAWALERAGLAWPVIDHDAPAPLSTLWAREDLGCVMMCSVPYSQRSPRPRVVAAPVPSPARYGGRPVYFTDFAVRAGSRHQSLQDTFGGIIGYTLPDSMSGSVAPRRHLAGRESLYRSEVVGLLNARAVIEALDAGRIDVGPLDSYYHDLLRRNDPAFAAKVRTVESTAAAPIPPLVATAPVDARELERLRAALLDVAGAPELRRQRELLLLTAFAVPEPGTYDLFVNMPSIQQGDSP
jgi:ABC-type phosphate/phosphonate transport system substrate-binding protein